MVSQHTANVPSVHARLGSIPRLSAKFVSKKVRVSGGYGWPRLPVEQSAPLERPGSNPGTPTTRPRSPTGRGNRLKIVSGGVRGSQFRRRKWGPGGTESPAGHTTAQPCLNAPKRSAARVFTFGDGSTRSAHTRPSRAIGGNRRAEESVVSGIEFGCGERQAVALAGFIRVAIARFEHHYRRCRILRP
jgi:hypothetical protein